MHGKLNSSFRPLERQEYGCVRKRFQAAELLLRLTITTQWTSDVVDVPAQLAARSFCSWRHCYTRIKALASASARGMRISRRHSDCQESRQVPPPRIPSCCRLLFLLLCRRKRATLPFSSIWNLHLQPAATLLSAHLAAQLAALLRAHTAGFLLYMAALVVDLLRAVRSQAETTETAQFCDETLLCESVCKAPSALTS